MREDVCLIFALGSVSRNVVPRAIFPDTVHREQGMYWKILSLEIYHSMSPLIARKIPRNPSLKCDV